MDQSTINTLLNLLSSIVHAHSRLESRILQHEELAGQRHATMLEAIKDQSGSASISLEKLAKVATHVATIATALAKAWGPFLAFVVALWKGAWPWLRSVLGFG